MIGVRLAAFGKLGKREIFAVEVSGSKTTGVIRCDQPRVLGVVERHGRKVDELPRDILDEVLGKALMLFE
jgi:mRNA interferase ChpB